MPPQLKLIDTAGVLMDWSLRDLTIHLNAARDLKRAGKEDAAKRKLAEAAEAAADALRHCFEV